MMTQEDFKLYKNPASVTGYKIEGDSSRLHWGYGFTDMLRREKVLEKIVLVHRELDRRPVLLRDPGHSPSLRLL